MYAIRSYYVWLTPISAETASYSAPLAVMLIVAIAILAKWGLRRGAVRRVRRCDLV